MLLDPLGNALAKIRAYEDRGKKEVILSPTSNLIQDVLTTLQKAQYVGEIELIKDGRGDKFKVQLLGRINKCSTIKPRYSLGRDEIIDYEKQYLPAFGFGILVMSTSQGVMAQTDALEKGIGGRLLAYVY